MIHVRVDDDPDNARRQFACGLGPDLPAGDVYFFAGEPGARRADCPGCNPAGPREPGTPISRLCGPPGSFAHERFKAIAESWGYD